MSSSSDTDLNPARRLLNNCPSITSAAERKITAQSPDGWKSTTPRDEE